MTTRAPISAATRSATALAGAVRAEASRSVGAGAGGESEFRDSQFAHDFSGLPGRSAPAFAAEGVAGAGGPLPHAAAIQRSFGRHRLDGVRAFHDRPAALAATQLGARAYAMGDAIAFAQAPDLATAAHEAAHVVQQRAGVDLPAGVGATGDRYERHADAVAAAVCQGRSAEPILDLRPAGGGTHRAVQRLAFVNEKRITTAEKTFSPEMKAMVTDKTVRNYTDTAEFRRHAERKTDYLGNLTKAHGETWVRFSPTGINLLGEYHNFVTLEEVVPAVGSKSFIYEPFSADKVDPATKFGAAYLHENDDRFKRFGVGGVADKQQFGAETLLAKMGYGMTTLLHIFTLKDPIEVLKPAHYVGQPAQRYLKIAWGWSQDNKVSVAAKQKAGTAVPPKLAALAAVHASVEGKLDKFITALPVDGLLGDELAKKGNDALIPPLKEFATAFSEAMVRMAAGDASSRMSHGERLSHSGSTPTSLADKQSLFSRWRDYNFEDNVAAATKRGVRYAGMGQAHLTHLLNVPGGLAKGQHPFDLAPIGKDFIAFQNLTEKLRKSAGGP